MDTNRNAVALRYLRYLAVREGGYVRRGVPGWALREDVERGTRLKLPERLPRLHAQGLLDREDVRAPRLTRPVWIYRISQAGADLVAEQEGLPQRVIPRPLHPAAQDADAAIYVPPGAALALRELRRATEARIESPHLPGEPGWRTLQDLRAQILGEDTRRTDWEPRRSREPWEREGGVMEADTLPGEPWMGDHDRRDQVAREEREAGWDMLFGEAPLAPRTARPVAGRAGVAGPGGAGTAVDGPQARTARSAAVPRHRAGQQGDPSRVAGPPIERPARHPPHPLRERHVRPACPPLHRFLKSPASRLCVCFPEDASNCYCNWW